MNDEQKNIEPGLSSSVMDTDAIVFSEQALQKFKEEERERSENTHKRIVKIGSLALFTLVIFIIASIAWFTMNRENETDGMNLQSENNGFDLQVESGTIGFEDLYEYLDDNLTGNSDTITNDLVGGQVISWRMSDGDESVRPGSQGELHFKVIPKGTDISNLKYHLHLTAYSAETHIEYETDEFDNTTQNEIVDSLTEIISSNYSGTILSAADYINNHVMFFTGRHGNTKENYEYYGFIDDKDDFTLELDEQGNGVIYWIWPNTFGQIALESTDTEYIKGSPVLYTGYEDYEDDRDNMTAYLKSNSEVVFSGLENYSNLIGTLYDKKDGTGAYSGSGPQSYKTEFDKLSEGYNAADQTIGTYVDYILIEMKADIN